MGVSRPLPDKIENVTAICKANIFFDGKVISHTLLLPDGSKKTLGLIYPGAYSFNTGAPERMEIIAGDCRARIAGKNKWETFKAGTYFDVPGQSSFEITVDDAVAQYVCSFLG